MNNFRRKSISEIMGKLQDLVYDLECVRDEEQEAYDNMPENLQYSERGEHAETVCENLDEACGMLDDLIERLMTVEDD